MMIDEAARAEGDGGSPIETTLFGLLHFGPGYFDILRKRQIPRPTEDSYLYY
ncbi:unnamed protein product [Coffea canephora]|uniref:Uncharacterized protein n=1 Tax=Coffea canephora TaxID=49390 RepID=A0A068U917_COFCA|nr:unnamed protein product [Coffea canephora]